MDHGLERIIYKCRAEMRRVNKVRKRMYSNGKRPYMGRRRTVSDVDLDWKIGPN